MKHILIILIILLLLLTALTCNAQVPYRGFAQGIPGETGYYDSFPIKSGLIGAWIVDGYTTSTLATDVSGVSSALTNSNGGIYTNYAGFASYLFTNGYIKALSIANLKPTNVTFSTWVYYLAAPGVHDMTAGLTDTAGNWVKGYLLGSYFTVTRLYFQINAIANRAGDWTVPVGRWHHVVGTYDGLAVRMYTNGAQFASTAYTNTITYDATSAFTVGAVNNTNYKMVGYQDTISVFNRALTPAEVAQLYTTGKSGGRHP